MAPRGKRYSLYRTLMGLTNADLENRALVWGIASRLWGLIDAVNGSRLYGDEGGLEAPRWLNASRALRDRTSKFTHDSRDLFRRSLATWLGPASMSVTLVEVFGLCYVSGLQLGWDE